MFALAASVFAARILGKAEYGEFGMIQTSVGMFGTIAGFGMGTTAAKFLAELRETDRARAGRIVALTRVVSWAAGGILCLIMALLATTIADATLHAPQLGQYLRIGSVLILLGAIAGAQTGSLSGLEAFREIARVNTFGAIASFPLIVGGAWLGGLLGLVLGMILAQLVTCVLGWIVLRRELSGRSIPQTLAGWKQELPVLWRFSLPAVAGSLVMPPVTWAASAILVRRVGFEQLGAFNAANQWFNAMLWLPYVFSQALLPILSERIAAADRHRSSKLLIASINANLLVSAPIVVIGSLLSSWIMRAYGPDFAADWPTLVVVLLTGGIASIQVPIGNTLAASGRMWLGFCMNLAWSAVFISVTWLLLSWGGLGLATARLLAYITQGVWAVAYSLLMLRRLKA
jgi:O-antigen/teichoic acid export membrane protein